VTAVLEVREPNQAPRTVAVSARPLRIGRATDSDLVLRDGRVSRQHARLHGRDGVLVLTDLGSTNGTRVNGQRIREVVLGAGDQIGMGDSVLVLGSSPVELKDPGVSGDAGAAVC
jgi:pSer/pThr/pTyr-binding forkhead associated (FHA) protein